MIARRAALVVALGGGIVAAAACCTRERTGTVAGPGLTVAPQSSSRVDVDASVEEALGSPVTATFIDLSTAGAPIRFRACEQVVIAVAKGKARALDEELAAGDLLLAQGTGGFDVKGEGLALLAAVRTRVCDPPTTAGITKHVVRGAAAPELTWADGKMHARLDTDNEPSSLAYVGRLSGTASVAEHRHEGSWEILSAVDAAGTFTIGGKPSRLGPRQVVVVPPNVPHAWKADEGANLVAIQIYSPSGPEQRFKALAAASAGAGTAGSGDAGAARDATSDASAKKPATKAK